VHFVETGREAVAALEANLAICGVPASRYHVHRARVAELLAREPNPMAGSSIIYADPPYDADLAAELLDALDAARFPDLDEVVVEHRTKQRVVPPPSLRIERERRFGDTTLTYLIPAAHGEEGLR
jgi:16S rRNA G966 N2-methylase RsmD